MFSAECVTMQSAVVASLEAFFEERAGEDLRSIITYDGDGHELIFLRDDVAAQYTDDELCEAIDGSRLESLYSPIYEDVYADDHGELQCLIQCFDDVIEINFALGDGEGAAVAIDAAAMEDAHGIVADARSLIARERE
jgi:hypothetical protein